MLKHPFVRPFLATGAVLLAAACSSTSAQQAKRQQPSDVVATVGGESITLDQVDQKAMEQPAGTFGALKLSQALYEARRAAAEEIVGNTLINQEAKKRGVEVSALVEQEITAKVKPVAEEDIAAWYQENPQRVQGASLDQVRAPIQSLLAQERTQTARETFVESLKAKTPTRVTIEPPRAAVSAGNSPSRGSSSAPIELIEFADFQCPYCQAVSPTLKRVLDTYGDRIRFVYRNFPLANHPQARPAAEAAQCANEQGKFWPFHDRLFGEPGKLSDEDLKKTAAALGMDAAQFNKCVDERKYRTIVETDTRAGTDAGVTGTPAFFVNGRLLSGAQPFDVFKRVIDDELELKRR
jgi:protein-disulfide isomerase